MMDLLEIEVEIVKISNYQGSALASGVMWPSRSYVSAKNESRNRRKKFKFLE